MVRFDSAALSVHLRTSEPDLSRPRSVLVVRMARLSDKESHVRQYFTRAMFRDSSLQRETSSPECHRRR